jgi:type I restriction enzyme S subunit
MSNFVPKGWESSNIRALVKFIGGSQPPRDTFIFQKKEGYVRLLQIRDYKSDKYASFIPTSLSRRWCNKDDIMIGRYGPPIFQIMRGKEGSYNVALIKAEPKSDKLLKSYLYEFIRRDDLFHVIDSYSQRTSGQTGIDMDALNDFHFPLPPLPEQQKIAQILTSVDEVIEKTQAQIDKLKDLKTGMMQELLTKGIGHLEFKDSPLGMIPVGWEVGRFDSLCVLQRGVDLPTQKRIEGDVPIFGSNGIVGYHNETKVSGANVITGRSGSIGDVMYVEGDCWPLNTSLYIRDFHDNLPKFVYYFLQHFDLGRFGTGTGVPTLNRNDVHIVQVAKPPIEEQKKIAMALTSVDSKLEKLNIKFGKLTSIKKALMQDLLTGKVRVSTEQSNSPLTVG